MDKNTEKKYAETYLGAFGGFLPIIVMIIVIAVMSVVGMRNARLYWSSGFLALIAGFLVYKDKGRFQKAATAGVQNPTFSMLVLILIISSIFSKILSVGNLAGALFSLLAMLNIPAGILPIVCFIASCFMSTATGSAAAALTTLVPVLMPLAVQMGIPAPLAAAAIASGSVFGDNIAPISDTTVASTYSVGADLSKAVKTRFKYSMAAAVPCAVIFLVLGFIMKTDVGAASEMAGTGLKGLVFLVLPVLLLVLILKKVNFLAALLLGCLLGIIMLLVMGYADVAMLFSAEGVIITGIEGMLNIIIFMMFIFIVLSLIDEAGALNKLISFFGKFAKSARSAEAMSGIFICVTVVATASGVSSMGFCGPIISKVLTPFGIAKERMSNLLDGLGCAVVNMLPYAGPALVTVALSVGTGAVSENFSVFDYLPYNFFPMALFLVYWIAVFTGWGRKIEKTENVLSDK